MYAVLMGYEVNSGIQAVYGTYVHQFRYIQMHIKFTFLPVCNKSFIEDNVNNRKWFSNTIIFRWLDLMFIFISICQVVALKAIK